MPDSAASTRRGEEKEKIEVETHSDEVRRGATGSTGLTRNATGSSYVAITTDTQPPTVG
jgi:hypothetical protein